MTPENTTILTVDDTPANIRLLTHYLEKQGYNVITAEDGFEGFKAAIQHHPDLILLDVMMPGTDGYEVCELLKAEEETKDIPVMFLTAKTDVEDKVKGFELGAVDYVTKPFNLVEISTRVQTQLMYQYLKKQNKRYHQVLLKVQPYMGLSVLMDSIFTKYASVLGKLDHDFMNESNSKSDGEIGNHTREIKKLTEWTNNWKTLIDSKELEHEPFSLFQTVHDLVDIMQDHVHGSFQINVDMDHTLEVSGDRDIIQMGIMAILMNAYDNIEGIGQISILVTTSNLPDALAKQFDVGNVSEFAKIDITETESSNAGNYYFSDEDLVYMNKSNSKWNINLSSAYWIACSHKGALNIQSRKEGGTTISLYLPC